MYSLFGKITDNFMADYAESYALHQQGKLLVQFSLRVANGMTQNSHVTAKCNLIGPHVESLQQYRIRTISVLSSLFLLQWRFLYNKEFKFPIKTHYSCIYMYIQCKDYRTVYKTSIQEILNFGFLSSCSSFVIFLEIFPLI